MELRKENTMHLLYSAIAVVKRGQLFSMVGAWVRTNILGTRVNTSSYIST